jgi:hypothetical protein
LVQILEHFGDYVIQLERYTASEVWHFVVTIGKEVYGFIVDTVEKIADALKAIWEKIAKEFEGLWNFLKYLFEWQNRPSDSHRRRGGRSRPFHVAQAPRFLRVCPANITDVALQ